MVGTTGVLANNSSGVENNDASESESVTVFKPSLQNIDTGMPYISYSSRQVDTVETPSDACLMSSSVVSIEWK